MRLVAKAAFGGVEDALERQIIVGRHDQPEIGHGIANLHPFIESRAADDTVGQTDGQEPVLERAHLVRGADKDGHLVKAHAAHATGAALHRLDFLTDPAGLFLAIPITDQADFLALLRVGPKGFAQTPLVPGDHARGSGKDMRGGAVILFEPHHMRALEILFEPQDVAHLGAAPTIDRLVVVAHAADVLVGTRQKPQPQVLRHVCILIFVHKDVFEPALVLVQHIGMRLKDRDHMQKQVAEIDRIQFLEPRLIKRIELGPLMVVRAGIGGGHLVRRDRAVLPAVDDPGKLPRGPAFVIDPGGLHELFEQPQLVVGVQNREVRFQPHQFGMAAQQFHAD